jgi:hypothetical protein
MREKSKDEKIYDRIYEQVYPYVKSALESKIIKDTPIHTDYTKQEKQEITKFVDNYCPKKESKVGAFFEQVKDYIIKIINGESTEYKYTERDFEVSTTVIISGWLDLMYLTNDDIGDSQLNKNLIPTNLGELCKGFLEDSWDRAIDYTPLCHEEIMNILKEWGQEYVREGVEITLNLYIDKTPEGYMLRGKEK